VQIVKPVHAAKKRVLYLDEWTPLSTRPQALALAAVLQLAKKRHPNFRGKTMF